MAGGGNRKVLGYPFDHAQYDRIDHAEARSIARIPSACRQCRRRFRTAQAADSRRGRCGRRFHRRHRHDACDCEQCQHEASYETQSVTG